MSTSPLQVDLYRFLPIGCSLLLLAAQPATGAVVLPPIFSEHMVLQRSEKVPVWGRANPQEAVRLELAGVRAETKADTNGRWKIELDLSSAKEGPHRMVVEGENRLEIQDVLIGEVWVCSGQSNMAQEMFRLQTPESAADTAQSANPKLRHFRVKQVLPQTPAEECGGSWAVAGPETTRSFSAVAYYFGKKVQKELNAPVGLINASVAGTPVEGWTSIEALSKDPDLGKTATEALTNLRDFPKTLAAFQQGYRAWEQKYERQDKPTADPAAFAAPDACLDGWQTAKISGTQAVPIPCGGGAIWLRRKVNLPESATGKNQVLELAIPAEFETVYWNGERVGGKTLNAYPGRESKEKCIIPADLLRAGENTLAIRIFNPLDAPAVIEAQRWLRMDPNALDGAWLVKQEFTLPALGKEAKANYPAAPKAIAYMQRVPTLLFNGMVHPIIPYAIRGIAWYQGEDNTSRAFMYRKAFPLLINDWRGRWDRGDLPFYYCQLANFRAKQDQPGESKFAELRDAQSMALSLPNTGQAVLIDVGEEGQIHYAHKEIAGERLASIALAKTYQKNVPYTGPVYESMTREGSAIRIHFKKSDSKLVAKPLPSEYLITTNPHKTKPLVANSPKSQLEGFAICGEDHQWVWADARIDGGDVVVESPKVAAPVAVRYGWANNPTCNLYNSDGFPASPFRTDDFPGITGPVK